MATAMSHMSMLPAIKCSTCGADVDLAMMGDHVCDTKDTPASLDHLAAPSPDVPALPSFYAGTSPSSHQQQPFGARPLATQPTRIVTTPSGGQRMNLGPTGTAVAPLDAAPAAPANNVAQTVPDSSPIDFSGHRYLLDDDIPPPSSATSNSSNPYFWQPSEKDDSPAPALSPASAPDALLDTALTPNTANAPHSPLIPSPLSAPVPLTNRPDSASIFHQFSGEQAFGTQQPALALPEKSKARPKPPPAPLQLSVESARQEGDLAPLSPIPGGANVIRRLDTIAPGPFDARHRKTDSRDGSSSNSSGGSKGFSLFRRKSTKRNKSSISGPTAIVDAPPMPSAEPGLFVGGTLDNHSPTEQTPKYDNFGQPLPTGPAPPRPARPAAVDTVIEKLQFAESDSAGGARSAQDKHSEDNWARPGSSSARESDDLAGAAFTATAAATATTTAPQKAPRVTSDASVYTIASNPDRTTAFGTELPQIREDEDPVAEAEVDADAPPAWPSGRLRSASRIADGSRPKPDQIPPLPNMQGGDDAALHQHHTPTESISSQDSRSVFDDKRESFRSSPPTSTASSFSPGKRSMDESNDLNSPVGESLSSAAFNRAANFSRPRAPTDGDAPASPPRVFAEPEAIEESQKAASPPPPPPPPPTTETTTTTTTTQRPPEIRQQPRLPSPPTLRPPPRKASLSPLQPPPMRGSSRQYAGPGTFSDAPPSPMFPPSPMHPPPTPSMVPTVERRAPPPRKSSGVAKSCCRGCDLPIEGKSVKAADGRLTGRYHRECFVCKACKERFPTAEFYILDDHPYCGPHYHELNGSLCGDCGRGIEGRYIETEGARKHHLYCFTCAECSKPLSQDYFEIDGKFYCEADAGRMHQKTSMLAPGRKFPERRTTRLMMM